MKRIFICIFILGVITSQTWARSVENDGDEDPNSNEAVQPEPHIVQSNIQQSSVTVGDGQPGNLFFSSQSYGPNGNSVFIKVSNPWITFDGKLFNCSGHACPNGTFKCEVSSEADSSNNVNLNSVAKCYDQSGELLDSKNFVESNPYPNAEKPYSRTGFVTSTGEVVLKDSNGFLNHISGQGSTSLTKEEQEEIRERHAEITRLVNQQIVEQQRRLQEYLAELQRNLYNRFQGDFWAPNSAYQSYPSYNPYFPFYQPVFQPFPLFPPGFPFYNPATYYPAPAQSPYQPAPISPIAQPSQVPSQTNRNAVPNLVNQPSANQYYNGPPAPVKYVNYLPPTPAPVPVYSSQPTQG